MNVCIGIISYLPNNNKREIRFNKLKNLLKSLEYFFDNMHIIIIAQNYNENELKELDKDNLDIVNFKDRLGINGARRELRNYFLNKTLYDYIIMLDDDCKLEGDKESADDYISQINEHPGMCGLFAGTLLKLFAISRDLFEKVDFLEGSVEEGDFFEDILFVSTIKKLYPDKIFIFNRKKLKEISNNVDDENSTWYWGQYNKHDIGDRTRKILGDL